MGPGSELTQGVYPTVTVMEWPRKEAGSEGDAVKKGGRSCAHGVWEVSRVGPAARQDFQ